jgi:hypothetical protein
MRHDGIVSKNVDIHVAVIMYGSGAVLQLIPIPSEVHRPRSLSTRKVKHA